MNNKKNLYKIEESVKNYKTNLLSIDRLLQNYNGEDRKYLIFEKNRLQEKITNIEKTLRELINSSEESQTDINKIRTKYFEEIIYEFDDFLIILKYINYGSIKTNKLQTDLFFTIKEQTSFPPMLSEKKSCSLMVYSG